MIMGDGPDKGMRYRLDVRIPPQEYGVLSYEMTPASGGGATCDPSHGDVSGSHT